MKNETARLLGLLRTLTRKLRETVVATERPVQRKERRQSAHAKSQLPQRKCKMHSLHDLLRACNVARSAPRWRIVLLLVFVDKCFFSSFAYVVRNSALLILLPHSFSTHNPFSSNVAPSNDTSHGGGSPLSCSLLGSLHALSSFSPLQGLVCVCVCAWVQHARGFGSPLGCNAAASRATATLIRRLETKPTFSG